MRMLIEKIKADSILQEFLCDSCFENGIGIHIDETINTGNIVIIKVDDYYNKLVANPPKSPDCLIVQKCSDGKYRMYIVELKNIKSASLFKVKDIVAKFKTCFEDFILGRFSHFFYNNENVSYQQIKLFFITDPYKFKKYPNRQEMMSGSKFDALLSQRIPKYFNKHLYIEHRLPDPTIKNCNQ